MHLSIINFWVRSWLLFLTNWLSDSVKIADLEKITLLLLQIGWSRCKFLFITEISLRRGQWLISIWITFSISYKLELHATKLNSAILNKWSQKWTWLVKITQNWCAARYGRRIRQHFQNTWKIQDGSQQPSWISISTQYYTHISVYWNNFWHQFLPTWFIWCL